MRRLILPISITVVLLISSFIFIPYLFKDRIIATIKTEANKQLKAQLEFDNDIGINVFKTFPNLTITLNNLVVKTEPNLYDNDTLISIAKTNISFDLMEFYRNQKYLFRTLQFTSPKLYLESKDTLSNWDIFYTEESNNTSFPINLNLEKITIENGLFSYKDGKTLVTISAINHSSSGIYSTDVFQMDARSNAKRVTATYDEITYLDKWEITQQGTIGIDIANNTYSFPNNEFIINGLVSNMNGDISLDEDDILFNLKASTSNAQVHEIITLIPAIYTTDYQNIVSKGTGSFLLSFIGTYNDTSFPAYAIRTKIENGYFKYPDMPLAMEELNSEINIFSKDGVVEHTVVDIPTIKFNLDNNPFSGRLKMTQLFTNTTIDLSAHGVGDLGHIAKLIPTQDLEMSGNLKVDLDVAGNVSAIQQAALNQFSAAGEITIQDLAYKSGQMPEGLSIQTGHLSIRNQGLTIDKLIGSLGKNDVNFYGKFDHFFSYLLEDKFLQGRAILTSKRFNLNDFYSVESTNEQKTEMTLVEIPGNIKVRLTASVNELIYDDLTFNNFTGDFEIENKNFVITDLASNFLEGRVNFTGQYSYDPISPLASFNVSYVGIELHSLLEKLKIWTAFVPIAEKVESASSAQLKFKAPLNLNMSPKLEQVSMSGALSLRNLTLSGSQVLKSLDTKLGTNHFDVTRLRDILLNFKIEDGSLITEPFNLAIDKANLRLRGVSKLDKSIDYSGTLFIPSSYVKNEVNVINNILKNSAVKNLEIKPNEILELAVNISGKVDDPKVSLNLKEVRKSVEKTVRDSLSNIIDEGKQKAKDELENNVTRLKEEADKKIEDTRKKVSEELETKRKEAEEKLRLEAEEKKKRLKVEANKKLKNIFK